MLESNSEAQPVKSIKPVWDKFSLVPLLLALGVLLAFHLWKQPTQLAHYTDPIIYLSGAQSLVEGHGYRFIAHAGTPRIGCQPPLQAAYLSLFWRLNPHFPENISLLYGAMFIAVIATFILFYRYCLKNDVPPVLAALLILAWGFSAQWTALTYGLMSDVLFGALALALANYWMSANETHSPRRWFITGVLVTLMYLTRTAATAVVATLACVVAFQSWRRREFKPLLSYLVPVIPAVVLWKLWSIGSPTYGDYIKYRIAQEGGLKQVIAYNLSSALEYFSGLGFVHSVFGAMMDLPSKSPIASTALSPVLTAVTLAFCWTFIFFAVAGAWRAKTGRERVYALVVAAYLLQLCMYPANLTERALYVVLPFVLVWAWKGLAVVPGKVSETRSLRWAMATLIALNVIGNAVRDVNATDYLSTCSHRSELEEIGTWLKTNSAPDCAVAATLTEPVSHFYNYSQRRVVENPYAKKPEFSIAAHSTNGSPRIEYVLLGWYSNLKPEELTCRIEPARTSSQGHYRLYRVLSPIELRASAAP